MDIRQIEEIINATFSSPEEFAATLSALSKQSKLRQIEIAIDALRAKQTEVLAPIENERIELNNARLALLDELTPAEK